MARRIEVEIVGDSRSLERAFARSERSAKNFNRQMSSLAGATGVGGVFGVGKGGAIAAGAAAAAIGLRSVIKASSDAQVILGQTSVAVQDAGLSWARSGAQIEGAATRISKASSFDDEAVLQSFQVFVRGQKDVQRSLQLSALAADVARGRYTDLDSATQLVNKAAMGQIGALRRAGIQIDKNATATEALIALQKAYGGSAERYSESAAGATDRLHVSLENVEETLGKGILPVVTDFASKLSDAADQAERLAAVKFPGGGTFGGIVGKLYKKQLELIYGGPGALLSDLFKRGGKPGGSAGGGTTPLGPPRPVNLGFPSPPAGGPAGISAGQRNQWFDAAIGRQLADVQDISTLRGQIKRLQEISAQITARIAVTKDITRKLTLEDQVKEIARTIRGDRADIAAKIAADAKDAAAAAEEARRAAVEESFGRLDLAGARAETTKTIKDDLAAFKDQETAIRDQIKVQGRTLALETQLFNVQQQRAATVARQAEEQKRAAEERRQLAADAKAKAIENQMGWLDFAVERAEATKTIKDDIKAQQDVIAFLQRRMQQEGHTLGIVSEIWRRRQKIADLNKSKAGTDPLAGLMQVSSAKLTNILAAGTGLSGAGRRVLGANIAGAEVRPVHVHVNIDGREVGRAVTTQQARAGNRTANQTSGRRG